MFPPEMPQVDLPEFFGKMEEFRKIVSEVDIGTLPPEKAEFFRALLAEFDKSAAVMKAELPGVLDNLRTEYREAVASAENEHASNMAAIEKARQRLAETPAREAERARALAEASAKVTEQRLMEEAAEKEKRLAANPTVMPFSTGPELLKELQVLQAGPPAKESGQPKPTGHIWNNWDPNYQPEPGTIEKLSEDSGVVYLDPDLMRKIRSPRGE
jgi:hypothetical protein